MATLPGSQRGSPGVALWQSVCVSALLAPPQAVLSVGEVLVYLIFLSQADESVHSKAVTVLDLWALPKGGLRKGQEAVAGVERGCTGPCP